MTDPTPAAPSEQSNAEKAFDFIKEVGEKGFFLGVIAAVLYFGGKIINSEEGQKLRGKGAKTGMKVLGEVKDTLFDEDGEVADVGRDLEKFGRRVIREQADGLRRERRYRSGLGLFGQLRRAASPIPGWADTAMNAHRPENRRPRGPGLFGQLMQSIINRLNRPPREGPKPPGFMSRLGDAIISRIHRRPEGGSAS